MDKATYINLQNKIKAGTATPEEIEAVKEYDASTQVKKMTPAEKYAAAHPGISALSNEKTGFVPQDTNAPTDKQKEIMEKMNNKDAAGFLETGGVGTTTASDLVAQKDALKRAEDLDMSGETTVSIPETNAQKKVDELNNPTTPEAAASESVSEVAKPTENDTPTQAEAKKRYNKSMMSIWDAQREGLIDKETAGYFTIDAIATFAKNLGRSIGNVGAQFSGGTIDNGHDESKWEQRQDKMFNTELQAESEGLDTFQNKFNKLALNKASTVNDLLMSVKADADKLSDDNPLKITYLALAAAISSGQIDGNTTLAATGAKGISELFDFFKDKFGDKKEGK